jgi:hypothetical protein
MPVSPAFRWRVKDEKEANQLKATTAFLNAKSDGAPQVSHGGPRLAKEEGIKIQWSYLCPVSPGALLPPFSRERR